MIPPDRRILPASQAILIDKAGRATVPMYDFMRRVVEATAITPELLQQMQDLLAQFAALQAAIEALDLSQYTRRQANELITGEWTFLQPILGGDGTADRPEFTFRDDDDSGFYRVGDDNLGISTGAELRWDIDTARVRQSLPLDVYHNDGIYIHNTDPLSDDREGIELSTNRVGAGSDATLAFWETFDTAVKGFRFFMDGSASNNATFSFYRHWDNSGVDAQSEVYRVVRQTAGIDFLEQVRTINGSIGSPALAPTSLPGFGLSFDPAEYRAFIGGNRNSHVSINIQNTNASGFATFILRDQSGNNVFQLARANASASSAMAGRPAFIFINSAIQFSWEGTGHFVAEDNTEIKWGTGGDLRVFHNGTNSTIRNDTGNLSVLSAATEVLRIPQTNPRLQGIAGAAATPTWTFFGDPDTGMFSGGTNILSFATAATERAQIKAGGQFNFLGLSADPTLANGDFWYNSTANRLRARINGATINVGLLDVRTAAGTTDTLVLADTNNVVETTNGSAIAVTVPTDASVAIPIGATVLYRQMGAGQATFTGDTGVTVNCPAALTPVSREQYSTIALTKRAANTWVISGDLDPV